jgi:predicted PurR-regulated permease PerM
MYNVVTGYVNGQLVLAALASCVVMIALVIASTILNVSVNVVALTGLAFLTGLIPMIGQLIGGTIVVFACLLVSVPLAIVMAIFILLYQQVENISLQPYIQSRYNELSPLLVFVAALLGVGVGGLLGAFVAIPAFGCAKILLKDYLETRGLVKH